MDDNHIDGEAVDDDEDPSGRLHPIGRPAPGWPAASAIGSTR